MQLGALKTLLSYTLKFAFLRVFIDQAGSIRLRDIIRFSRSVFTIGFDIERSTRRGYAAQKAESLFLQLFKISFFLGGWGGINKDFKKIWRHTH